MPDVPGALAEGVPVPAEMSCPPLKFSGGTSGSMPSADAVTSVENPATRVIEAIAAPTPTAAALARLAASEAFTTVAGEAIQLHGGIAITWEHDIQLYFKRAHASAQLFGPPSDQLRKLESEVF